MKKKSLQEKYEGKFVAKADLNSKEIIAVDEKWEVVYDKAKKLGYNLPAIYYVSKNREKLVLYQVKG